MTTPVVIGRTRASGWYWRGVFYVMAGFGVLVLGALALSPNPVAGRLAAVAGIVVVVGLARWLATRLAPDRSETLTLTLDDSGITGRQHGEERHIPREDVWFVEVHEVHRLGVHHLGVVGPDGAWRHRWVTGWLLTVSTIRVCRQISRAGYPWVMAFDTKVKTSRGVPDEAKALVEANL